MGAGDDIMATGLARGARERGRRVAFGDGRKIIWGPQSGEIFASNPNIAPPGSERDGDLEWIHYYKGCRWYNRQAGDRWQWNYDFKPTPGEIFFRHQLEELFCDSVDHDMILVEPNVPQQKTCAPNKQWPIERWQEVVDRLSGAGHKVAQLQYGGRYSLRGVTDISSKSFREGLLALSRVKLFIGHEGGLHHGAAAVGTPAVVIFGGWVPPAVTGYPFHSNLTGLADDEKACGMLRRCDHCARALDFITVQDVFKAAVMELDRYARQA